MEPFYTGTIWLFAGNSATLNFNFSNRLASAVLKQNVFNTLPETIFSGGV